MTAAPPNAAKPGLRVLQVGPLYVNHVRRWAEHAAAVGCTVFAAGHVRPGRRLVDLTDVAERIEVAPEALWDLGTPPRVAWLRGVLRRAEPDLIQAHWLPTWGCFATLSGRRPVVLTPWGSDVYLSTGAERRRADLALRAADSVLARSHHMGREILGRGVPAHRVHQVDLGVDLARFRPPSPGERAALRRELDLPPGPIILSFRAGKSLYNLDIVIDAFRSLRTRLRDASLVLMCGDAPVPRSVRLALRRAGGREGVRSVGFVPHGEIHRYMRAATAGVSIPSSDGSPNSVWEALACGLPLVLSDLPQIAERVAASGAVRLVDTRPGAVAAALAELVERQRLRDRMAQAARRWAIDNADEREQVERLARVYAATTARPDARRPALASAAR